MGINKKVNKTSKQCPLCQGYKVKKNGSFTRIRNRRKVQRYICTVCKITFSDQSIDITFRQHRPDLLEKVMYSLCSGMGTVRMAVALKTTPKTIQRKIKHLAIICDSFQNTHMNNWKVKPQFQFDEMWSCEKSRGSTLTVPTVVDKESYFIVAARAAHDFSLLSVPYFREENNAKRWHRIKNKNKEITAVLNKCNIMKPNGRIVMETDKKIIYQKLLKNVFRKRLVHIPYDASKPHEAIKLFPINNTMACFRAEMAKFRRESWYISKSTTWLNAHIAIYTVFYNYFRKKKYTETRTPYLVTDPSTGKALTQYHKTYKTKTPAMRLGIFDKPITFQFLMQNFGIEISPVSSGKPIPLIPKAIPILKAA